ncbi:hypothetical protein DFJ58DRAFT_841218 [Suillus subalutaceus]|uniref:uncharacterized protein n=1 Tax=Suillus subalutaceus TaxID=48586 RepID=UPI001B869B0B|nr:uncharacterized protein DFJ58DRAFT_841218 [Suillus subalutaceus]KAG1855211.1 hypothetical protein DFJ58DRAFT_841218 [Suillus subalutaceus]
MMTPGPGVDLAGAVLATMWHGSALGLAIAAVLGLASGVAVLVPGTGGAVDDPWPCDWACCLLQELRLYEDRDERRWTTLSVAGVQLLHRYRGESGGRTTISVREGMSEYCECVVQENNYEYRVLQRTERTEMTHLGTILHAVEKALWYSTGLDRWTSRSIVLE